ncbi:unnamed protein product [Clavelina lepadiformis]|uniref:Uncharacterized protein n=1 Tax=Clavelina lepadiformis TaxID=159417 RepID=A0ABP0FAM5_CLALP
MTDNMGSPANQVIYSTVGECKGQQSSPKNECLCHHRRSKCQLSQLPTTSAPSYKTLDTPGSREVFFYKNQYRGREANAMKGVLTLSCLSALMAMLSVILLHAMSSIWLDPKRNLKLNEEFVYITVTLAATSASLNFCALSTFCIQIYLVYTDHRQDEYVILRFLQEVSTIRFVASFSVFISIPIFMTSFAGYMYMEFRPIAAFIAMSVMGAACLYIIVVLLISYCKWNKTQQTVSTYAKLKANQKIQELPNDSKKPQNVKQFVRQDATSPGILTNHHAVAKDEIYLMKPCKIEQNHKTADDRVSISCHSNDELSQHCEISNAANPNKVRERNNVIAKEVKKGSKSVNTTLV